MNYRTDKYGNPLSILGFGCMRFQRKGGRIDMEEMEKEILLSIEQGVNYFDTAYIYPGSEAALGQVLEKNGLRETVNIATKLPHYLIKNKDGLEKLFQEELRRLRTDHVDYYLMHMLNDVGAWERLKKMGIEEWIAQKKASGAIRQVSAGKGHRERCKARQRALTPVHRKEPQKETGATSECTAVVRFDPGAQTKYLGRGPKPSALKGSRNHIRVHGGRLL